MRIEISDGVLSQDLEGQRVLFSLEKERYFALDPVGARIWELIGGVGDRSELLAFTET